MNTSLPSGRRVLAAALVTAGLGLASCATDIRNLQSREALPPTRTPETTIAAGGEATNPLVPSTSPAATSTLAPLQLTAVQAIVAALEGNAALKVQRLSPLISAANEDQARAAFDPTITGSAQRSRERSQGGGGAVSTSDALDLSGQVSQTLPTGTTLNAGASENVVLRRGLNGSAGNNGDFYSTRVGAGVTQALLRGRNVDANLASLRQARLDTLTTEYQLRGYAESLVAQTEEAFWDAVLAQRQIQIYTESLALAQQQYAETQERIKVGKLAETELVAAAASIATRQEGLINAKSALATAKLKLLRLLNPPGGLGRELSLDILPKLNDTALDDLQPHLDLAVRLRPELNETRLLLQRNELELVKTADGLLPKLDLFITLGKTGYSQTFLGSLSNYKDPNYDVAAGLTYTFPVGNREAKAQHARAQYTKQQTQESLANLAQSVEVDVRGAYIELGRAQEQIAASAAARALQEENLRAETEKYHVGKSTSLLVAQVQNDLLTAQIAEVQAVVTYLKDQIELYRLEGSLLIRRGITSPGAKAVEAGAASK